jgi:O-acetylserine/cysteine efflux transporter
MSTRLPVLALVLASMLWGVATSATKFALGGFGPVTLLAIELLAATAALWVCLLVRGYRPPSSWRLAATLALLEPAVAYLGATAGLARTSASNAALLFGLESAFAVLLAAVFLREPLSRALGIAVVAAILGLIALESATDLTGPRLGDLFVLCGALSAAGYTVVARQAGDGPEPFSLTAHQFAFASLFVTPIALMAWANGSETVPTHVAGRYWLAALAVGVAGFAITFLLYNYAIGQLRAGTASVIINLIPAFGLASAVLWLDESLTAVRLGGAALIAVSVATFAWTECVPTINARHRYRRADHMIPGYRRAGHMIPGYRRAGHMIPGYRRADTPSSSLPMCRIWICDVPSGIVASRASRKYRSTGDSSINPAPPCTCMASVAALPADSPQ